MKDAHSQRCECGFHVGPEVFNVLDANAQSNESRHDASRHANIFGDGAVTGIERTLNERFNAAQTGGFVDDVQVAHEGECRCVAAFHNEGDHAGAVREDALGYFVIGVALQLGMIDALDGVVGLKRVARVWAFSQIRGMRTSRVRIPRSSR